MNCSATLSAPQPKEALSRSEEFSPQQDDDLRRRILNFLYLRHVPALRRVTVNVDHGVVEIRGRVNTFYEKQLCLSCCQRVAGVTQIDDQVEVA